jgi:hypothetical protein
MNPETPVVVVNAKPWWKSKTLWLNLIAAALIALEAEFSLLQPLLPGNVYAYFAVVLPVANALLRVITVAPIAFGITSQS